MDWCILLILLYYKYKIAEPAFSGYLISFMLKNKNEKYQFHMYEIDQDYIKKKKEVLLIKLVFIKLWLHINDSTPKLPLIIFTHILCYDYILMIAHQNQTNAIAFSSWVMITY